MTESKGLMKKLLLVVALGASSVFATQLQTGTVSGQILSREGQAASGIRVSAMAVPEPGVPVTGATALVGIGMTDSTGRYRLENIPPGRYYVVAGLVDFPTYYPGVSSVSGATVLNVLSGTPITGINFTMAVSAGVTVSGRLVHPNGTPATEVQRVGLAGGARDQLGPIPDTAVQRDGTFQFLRVRPGIYQLLLTGVPSFQPFSMVVGDKDVAGIEVQVLPTVTLTGTLNVEGDGLRPRLTITFSPFKGGGTIPSGYLSNGSFRVTLPEGEYRIGWSGLPAGYELKSITAGSTDLLSTALKISAGSPFPPIVVNLGLGEKVPWVKVSGRVKGLPVIQNGTPYGLTLTGSATDTLDVPIKPDGSFEFARLLPGSYSARITPNLPIAATSFTVVNRDLTDLNITIPPMKEIRGLASSVSGRSVALRINWSEPPAGTATSTAVIQSDGTFSVVIPEGERRITVVVPGYTVQSVTYGSSDVLRDPIRVSSADSSELRLTLVPAAIGGVAGGVGGGVVGGVVGGVLGGIITAPTTNTTVIAPPPPPPPPSPPPLPALTRIGGDVAQANLISSVPPAYPEAARAAQVQGTVILQATISKDGMVQDLVIISGHPLLNDAAVQAVRQWRYRPQMVSGQAIPVITTITVNFAMR
jgi:TonB family protein